MGPMVIDNFAGGGGASMGIELAIGRPVDVAINHDAEAVAMHQANHPKTKHYTQDVWSIDPAEVCHGRAVALAWFSPDCKHFSKAKGGKPVEKKIRDLAWVVVRWAKAVRPAVIMLENVEEFRTWGPIDDDGQPIREQRGETFGQWCDALRELGYELEWRELRACDYGAPTIRKRLFIIARCDGRPIEWPSATHGKGLPPYRTAASCIDWHLPCPSIFERPRPLAEATMRRIAAGIKRYVIEAAEPFIVPLTHQGGARVEAVSEPFNTITGAHRGEKALVTPTLVGITHNKSTGGYDRVDQPMRTQTASKGGELALIAPTLVQSGYGEREGQAPRALDIEKPLGTIVGGAVKHALIAAHISRNNHDGAGKPADPPDEPLRTVTTQGNKHALVTSFLAKHFGDRGQRPGSPMTEPVGTVTAVDHHGLVTSNLVKLYGTVVGADVREPMPTTTAGGLHVGEVRAFLAAYYGNDKDGQGVVEPFRTVTSKERFALVMVAGEPYEIVDIGMRMLTPRELFRAQGFPEGYIIDPLVGGKRLTKTAQIRMCGNSVCPDAARALVAANVGRIGQQEMWRGYETAAAAGGAS